MNNGGILAMLASKKMERRRLKTLLNGIFYPDKRLINC
jgi:hypothetical protein